MVDKAKTKRVMNQFTPKRTAIAKMGSEPLELPNHSRGKAPEADRGLVNKQYVDSLIPVTHASTTGRTANDHHAQSHTIASHSDTTTDGDIIYFKAAGYGNTGGTITTDGLYTVHTFTSSGTFTTIDSGDVEYLVVAGGGGTGSWGGGGAGGFRTDTGHSVTAQAYSITVGAGGTGYDNGDNSSFDTISGTGGGKGSNAAAGDGGSGGGGSNSEIAGGDGNAGSYSPVEGYDGGDVINANAYGAGGGGGGSGSVGATGDRATGAGGNGGTGVANSITGSSVTYASGGGGGGESSAGTASAGGGGNGAVGSSGTNGTANTGGGSGGGNAAANGGSGIVIIRCLTADFQAPAGWKKLPIGSTDDVLTVVGGLPAWA